MEKPLNLIDEYCMSDKRTLLTFQQLHIPGIRILARQVINQALPPLQLHYHENAFEFTLLTEGTLTFSTETSSYRYSGGDVFISYPNEVHGTAGAPLPSGELYWFQLDISECRNLLFLDEAAAATLVERLVEIRHHVVNTGNKEMANQMKNAFRIAVTVGDPHLTAAYLVLFLNLLVQASQKTRFTLTPDIGQTLDYILDHISENLSLEMLAERCRLSTSQFKQKFKAQVGISPRNFINQQKIEAAKSLLLDGTSSTDTAMQLGFDTSSYFAAVFKKYTTQTPSEFVKASH